MDMDMDMPFAAFAEKHLRNPTSEEQKIIDQLRKENAEAKKIIRWLLNWIDAVPSATPGYNREYVENFLSGEVDDEI